MIRLMWHGIIIMKQFNPEDYRIFECLTGSKLYGTDTPASDEDFRGICIPPMEVLLDPFMNFEQKNSGFEEEDRTIYDLGKFMKLCADANPNILELLFCPEKNIIYKTSVWDKIIENKSLFLSKKIKHTFLGYSWAQINKTKLHRQWFLDPPKRKPTREDFGLTDSPILSGDNLKNSLNMPSKIFNEKYRDEIFREKEYYLEKKKWDNYISWFKNRNPKRRKLEEHFGYDTKYIMHVFRLLEEGKQLLIDGRIIFPLHNADELLEIRNGKYSYEEAISKALVLENNFESIYNESTLPHSSNKKELLKLYLDIVK